MKRILRRKKRKTAVYDRTGEPIDYEMWAQLINEPEYYMIASDIIDNVSIVTTWFGMDVVSSNKVYSSDEEMKDCLALFETEIKDSLNVVRQKFYYPSEEIAIKHHNKLVFMADQKMFAQLG